MNYQLRLMSVKNIDIIVFLHVQFFVNKQPIKIRR